MMSSALRRNFCSFAFATLFALPLTFSRSASAQSSPVLERRHAFVASQESAMRARVEGVMRRVGMLGSNVPISRVAILPPALAGTTSAAITRDVAPRATTSTKLKFSVLDDVSDVDDRNHVKDFIEKIYPYLVQVYGEPAPEQRGKTVTIQKSSDYEGYGTSLNGTNGGYIYYTGRSDNRTQEAADFALAQMMLNAFHGRQIFAYTLGDLKNDPKVVDAWELGFSYAAALQAYFLAKKSPSNFDPKTLSVYLLPGYDFLNKPELGTPLFSSANLQSQLSLKYYRYFMAQAAWLKVYVENPDFFKNFNAAYYASVANNAALAGNPDGLASLAATIVPQVEGLRFMDWYRRQYVLDTHASLGEKLYIGGFGSTRSLTSDGQRPFIAFAQHFRTYVAASDVVSGGVIVVKKGDILESPVTGNATVRSFDENGTEVTSKMKSYIYRGLDKNGNEIIDPLSSNVIPFDSADDPSEATFLVQFARTDAGALNAGRVSLQVVSGSTQTSAIIPNNLTGSSSAPNGYYGVYDPAVSGSVVPVANGKVIAGVSLQRGGFSSTASYPSGARTRIEFRLTSNAGTSSVFRNCAWSWNSSLGKSLSLAVLLNGNGTRSTVKVQLQPQGNNSLRLVSLPLKPELSDEADIFGLAPNTLNLARYRADAAVGSGVGQQSDKYERYPRITQTPGSGVGYWIHLNSPLNATVAGAEPNRTARFEMPLRGGWNQFGMPYNLKFSLDAIRVRTLDGKEYSYAQAVAARILLPGVWGWKAAGGYTRLDADDTVRRTLVPLEGYFIYAVPDRGVTLLFNAAQTTGTLTPSVMPDWFLAFSAVSGSVVDGDNAMGTVAVNSDGFGRRVAAPKPPLPETALSFAFENPNNTPLSNLVSEQSGGWGESYVPTLKAGQSAVWRLRVSGAVSGAKVNLLWSNTAVLPQGWDFTLIDETSGARWNLRYAPRNYPWTSNGKVRTFRVEAKPSTTTKTLPSEGEDDVSGSL